MSQTRSFPYPAQGASDVRRGRCGRCGSARSLGSLAAAQQDKYALRVRVGSRFLSSEDSRPGRLSPSVTTETCWQRSSPHP
jgi:hypothetical protein